MPPFATQPSGNRPLSDCIADTTVHPTCNVTVAGIGESQQHDVLPAVHHRNLNANDSRFGQVVYANGKLWGALGTALTIGGEERAGMAYYVLNPSNSKLVLQGQAGVDGTDLTYPAVGVHDNGRGIMSFTLTGDNDFPSAAYAPLDAKVGMGDVSVAASGCRSVGRLHVLRRLRIRPPALGRLRLRRRSMATASGQRRNTSHRLATTRRTSPTRRAVARARRSGTGRPTSAN